MRERTVTTSVENYKYCSLRDRKDSTMENRLCSLLIRLCCQMKRKIV